MERLDMFFYAKNSGFALKIDQNIFFPTFHILLCASTLISTLWITASPVINVRLYAYVIVLIIVIISYILAISVIFRVNNFANIVVMILWNWPSFGHDSLKLTDNRVILKWEMPNNTNMDWIYHIVSNYCYLWEMK